ncbi:hypothetical protein GH733_016907 [Mirounga leonina]|nr:hypothetical protein GH733_016907 [Mirounga leonina]
MAGMMTFPLVPLSPRLTAMLGRGKETLPLSLHLDLLLLLSKLLLLSTNSCGSLHASWTPLSLGHSHSHPPMFLSPSQGRQGPRRKKMRK